MISALGLLTVTATGALPRWLQDVPALNRIEGVFFRPMPVPERTVLGRKPPREVRESLSALIRETPSEANLFAWRAHEAEQALDFEAAEADWRKFADVVPDKTAGMLALADFYHRRLRPPDETRILLAVAAEPPTAADRLLPVERQRSWQTFERIQTLIAAHALPLETANGLYEAWVNRYPEHAPAYQRFFDFLVNQRRYGSAEHLIARYTKAFPQDEVFPMTARAALAEKTGSVRKALELYDQTFRPLWPAKLVQEYFRLLKDTRNLRTYLQSAKAAVARNPADVGPAARLFYYHQQQGNLAAAWRAIAEYRLRKETGKSAWTADELLTVARLAQATHASEEAARAFYALYSLGTAGPEMREQAFAGILHTLFEQPERPFLLGAGDLSYYRNIATLDPYPGYLNGILSLLFNSASAGEKFAELDQASRAYFHRARASDLLGRFDTEFPRSAERPGLHLLLIQAYATYGESDAVLRAGRGFMNSFARAPQRTEVALLMADAFARKSNTAEEFAIYDMVLKELAARADGVPLGEGAAVGRAPGEAVTAAAPRSPEYSRVLDRYISRLVSLKRVTGALALLRRELDRNPNDPGLYERLAAFLDQNRLDREIAQVYERAIRQFNSTSWYDKLARWYLRNKRQTEFADLTRKVTGVFSGTELEKYFEQVVHQNPVGMALYRQLNTYAHARFPYNMVFVRNLVFSSPTGDPERELLLSNYWYYDDLLRAHFFGSLSASGRLDAELNAARRLGDAKTNPAATRFVAEAEAWRSHFEEAAPRMNALAAEFPASSDIAARASALGRSLAAFDPEHARSAAAIEANLHRFDPRDRDALTRLGEIHADRGDFDRARPYWDRLAEIEPGEPDGYLEAATVFWDYFQFPDALRLIEAGRKKLSNTALFAYEAGAIHENMRDFEPAVAEYIQGALADADSPARRRLVRLARRPALRALVDKRTLELVLGQNPDAAAVELRIAVLQAQNRRDDLAAFLATLTARTASPELLARMESVAAEQGFFDVQRLSLERQVAVSADPVERMRLQLALVRFYEGRRDIKAAERVIRRVYEDNPDILGVVRATVDFYWRNKMPKRAVEVLARAASVSNAELAGRFTLEAARKSTEAADYKRARKLLKPLLAGEPLNAEYVAALADTYARQKDDRALRELYALKIEALRTSALPREERMSRIASLRRALIPVLSRQRQPDHGAAVDQYIEIIKSYPEDAALTREAASYAALHTLQERLLAYFRKAADGSPRDFRWPLILARIETEVENLPAAIVAYERASKVRPDRIDLIVARASLQERLMRLDEAAQAYRRAYELSYRDPQWMLKIAEIRARQGQTDAAVAALEKALIEGRPERPGMFFEVAAKLENWDMLPQARGFAERGVTLAGSDLLADDLGGAQLYMRVMTRLRAYEPAWGRIGRLPSDRDEQRRAVLNESAQAARRYFTPDEKTAFDAFLLAKWNADPDLRQDLALVARSAGLAERAVVWRIELGDNTGDVIEQQRARMQHAELGAHLENIVRARPIEEQGVLLQQAALAYRAAEDRAGEIRVLAALHANRNLSGEHLQRYLELLLADDPERLIQLAADRNDEVRFAALNMAVAHGTPSVALRAVASGARKAPPVWLHAYSALTGLYHRSPEAQSHFEAALGSGTIAQRLGRAVDRNAQLAGETWFYYGAAYGQYRAAMQSGDAEEYLPALVEGTPARPNAYLELAEDYRDRNDLDRALADYAHVLELDPGMAEVHNREAEVLWTLGRRDDAIREWNSALQEFARALDRRLSPAFWKDVRSTLENIGRRKLLAGMRADADRMLRIYIRRNGAYLAEPLLRGAYAAAADPSAGAEWIVDLSRAAEDSAGVLRLALEATWFPEQQRGVVYEELVRRAEARLAVEKGEAREWAASALKDARVEWIGYLLDHKETQRARSVFALVENPPAPLAIRLSALDNSLSELLERYRREPGEAPELPALTQAAAGLRSESQRNAADRVLEFAYARELERRNFEAVVFLGLAELRLEQGNVTDAVALLRRMILVAADPFEQYGSAASLLIRTGHPKEAAAFLEARRSLAPWDHENRLRLAQALAASGDISTARKLAVAIVQSPSASYDSRADAAVIARGSALPAGVPAELALLASGPAIRPQDAEKPFFYRARIAAAAQAQDAEVRVRLLSGALAIEPERNDPRPNLLHAAVEAGRFEIGIAAMEALLGHYSPRDDEDLEDDPHDWVGGASDVTTARDLATAFERTGDLQRAARYLNAALRLPSPAAVRAEVTAQLESLRARQRVVAANERGRPKIRAALEQEHLVKPKSTNAAIPGSDGGVE